MKNLLYIPTHSEMRKIKDRRDTLLVYHKRLYRKLLDLQSENGSTIIAYDKFREYAKKYVGIGYFDSALYYNYVKRMLSCNKYTNAQIEKFFKDEGYIITSSPEKRKKGAFANEREALSWLLSYRVTKMYFRKIFLGVKDEPIFKSF